MSNTSFPGMTVPRTGCCFLLGSVLILCGSARKGACETKDLSGTTDGSVRDVITLVADRQLRTSAAGSTPRVPADGSYPPATSLAEATNAPPPQGIEWNYPWGVNLYGLLQTYLATGNTNYLNFVVDHNLIVGRYYSWLRSLHNSLTNTTGLAAFQKNTALSQFISLGSLDACGAMTAQLMEGVVSYSDAITIEQLKMAQTTAHRIAGGGQARLPDGTLWRPEQLGGTIWADDLYMSCPFLIRWYRHTGDTNVLNDAALQIMNMAGYLQDEDGIWFHGYFYDAACVNGYKWGRANGWAMVATVEVLSVMPTNHPSYSSVLDILTRHIEGIKAVQAPSGMWRQVLDHPELWEETSCTAMFSYSIARAANRGWIDRVHMDTARRGFAALCANITTNGVVNGTCLGTGIGTNLEFYINRSRPSDDMHGRGAVLLAGSEILLNPKLHIAADQGLVAVSWPAGINYFTLETSSNLLAAAWSPCTNSSVVTTDWRRVVTDCPGDAGFYRLRMDEPVYPNTPLTFEAESLARTTHGATSELSVLDSKASGGYFVTFLSDGVGDYIEFTVTNVPAGEYRLKLNFKTNIHRGYVDLTVDGEALGDALDEYFYTAVYPLIEFGTVRFATPGDHTLRFTVSGKHGASSGYTFVADRIVLVPP